MSVEKTCLEELTVGYGPWNPRSFAINYTVASIMSRELAREIIDQSRPSDRHSRLLIIIENEGVIFKITAPVENGELVVMVAMTDYSNVLLSSLAYNAKSNVEGAARYVEGSLREFYPDGGACDAEMYRVGENERDLEGERCCGWGLVWISSDGEYGVLFEKMLSVFKALLRA